MLAAFELLDEARLQHCGGVRQRRIDVWPSPVRLRWSSASATPYAPMKPVP